MDNPRFEVLGGVRNFAAMTKELQDQDPAVYDCYKTAAWYMMIKQRMAPVKWYKPTKKGTQVKFIMIKDVDQAREQLEALRDLCRELQPIMEAKANGSV